MPPHAPMNSYKRQRRTATSVLAGDFDIKPPRDALTSLLNGVGPYKVVERDEESRRNKKREKRERDRERKREKAAAKAREKAALATAGPSNATPSIIPPIKQNTPAPMPTAAASSFWRARPAIHIPSAQRSLSVTPPPMPSSPRSTPEPSNASTYSRTSSKRPRTPSDYDDHNPGVVSPSTSSPQPSRKKRAPVRKGWKGWVEGSPPPSEKLINLDHVPVLQERRTRSGKSFDAIGVGKDSWV
ncbi:hypothetical protein JAAARDRAFT_34242 [Jaapia argillacea MUCL 33604]|uniref:Uncharacterized protein n=1 Tax=Jaapia argillacea MUCL 33604 TaxID=933084 RepID=A0A067PUG3_9AGAM|nr:hypothetical protein JAAARDRAFT_34242 [Jaapia argillacea MUCL 33604]